MQAPAGSDGPDANKRLIVARLRRWSARYFGDTSLGAATARFEAAIDRLWEQAPAHPGT